MQESPYRLSRQTNKIMTNGSNSWLAECAGIVDVDTILPIVAHAKETSGNPTYRTYTRLLPTDNNTATS